MGVLDEELNGCYAMLCEALRAWHRMQKDHPRETAAKVLKDVYGYEFHLNGGGCPWRLPSVDHERATNGMRALGLPADRMSKRRAYGLITRMTADRWISSSPIRTRVAYTPLVWHDMTATVEGRRRTTAPAATRIARTKCSHMRIPKDCPSRFCS